MIFMDYYVVVVSSSSPFNHPLIWNERGVHVDVRCWRGNNPLCTNELTNNKHNYKYD